MLRVLEVPHLILREQRPTSDEPAPVVDLPAQALRFEQVEDGRRVVDEEDAVVALVVHVAGGGARLDERAVAERLRRDGGEPVVADAVVVCEARRDGERRGREAVHDDARVRDVRLRGVVVDEALHRGRLRRIGRHLAERGRGAHVVELAVNVLVRLAGVRVRVCEDEALPDVDGSVGAGVREVLAVDTLEVCGRLLVKGRRVVVGVVEPAEYVVERTVLKHQHDDVLYFAQLVLRRCGHYILRGLS